jgi:glyoxylase-like metal-dependent hydrolase (beta-lactamase superfamily II)
MRLSLLRPGSGFPKLRSSVTLLEDDGRHVVVDSGLIEDRENVVAALAAQRLRPEDIDTVVTTHLHYDHCGNHLLFPNARYIVSSIDYADTRDFIAFYHSDGTPSKSATADLLRSRYQSIKEFYVRSIVREVTRNLAFYDSTIQNDERFIPIAGTIHLTNAIEVIATPGHTPGHLSVVARSVAGGAGGSSSVLIAGDAVYTRDGLPGDGESHLAWDASVYRHTRAELLSHYRWIIPGHDRLCDMHAIVRHESTRAEAAV